MMIPTSISNLVIWIFYFGLTAVIILADAKMQRAKARAAGTVDFADRKVLTYLALGVLCGPLPLIFYFGITRKSAGGWLLGLGAALAVSLAISVVSVTLRVLFGHSHGPL